MQQGDQAFAVGVQEAVITRAPETLGQDVLQDQAQEVGTRQDAHLYLTALAVAVAKADLAALTGQDVAFPEREQPRTDHGFWLFFAVDRSNEWKSWSVPNGAKLRTYCIHFFSHNAGDEHAGRP